MPDAKKEIRGRAQVHVHVSVRHHSGDSLIGREELAAAKLEVDAVLDRGDGSLLDNEYVVTGLVEKTLREAGEKVEGTLGDQFSERRTEVEDEQRALQLHDAERYIDAAEDVGERNRRRRTLGEFLNHDFGGPTDGAR